MRFLYFAFFITTTFVLQAEPLKVHIGAKSAILINAETGAILFAKEPFMACHPASITKIATALYVLEKKSHALQEWVTASQEAVGVVTPQAKRLGGAKYPPYRLTTDGTHMSLKAGETLTVRELLHGLLISSGNDAANVLAEYVSSSIPVFMEELNAYLKQLGCLNTRFVNPHGLPHIEQITTASDMVKITLAAMKYPLFREIVAKVQHPRPQTNKQPASVLVQMNRLLRRGRFFYPKAIGVKTGYTDAGANLVAAAQDGDRTLIAVILYSTDVRQRFQDATTLFEAAFRENKKVRTLLTKDHERFAREVKGGKNPLEAALIEDVQIEYYPSEEPQLKAVLKWDGVKLPIHEGQRVGEVQLISDLGKVFKVVPLFAKKEVEMNFIAQVGNVYELARAKKALIVAIVGLSIVGLGLFLMMKKSRQI
jgi:serine-type D-Ala-D-Ala carboxypeptidase (penicillin-binding protein 5/6)